MAEGGGRRQSGELATSLGGNAEGVRKFQPRATPWGKRQFHFLNSEGVREENNICKDFFAAVSPCEVESGLALFPRAFALGWNSQTPLAFGESAI